MREVAHGRAGTSAHDLGPNLESKICVKYLHCMYHRPPDKSVYSKIIFFISQPKHMLWVLKRTVTLRRFL